MSQLHIDHCENCGQVSNDLSVADGIIVCKTCVENRRSREYCQLVEMNYYQDLSRTFKMLKAGVKR